MTLSRHKAVPPFHLRSAGFLPSPKPRHRGTALRDIIAAAGHEQGHEKQDRIHFGLIDMIISETFRAGLSKQLFIN